MKIEKMTPEQEKMVPIYLKKWLDAGRTTKALDKEKTKSAINFIYDNAKNEAPKHYIFLDSPLQCQMAVNLIKNTKLDEKVNLRANLRDNLGDNLGANLWDNLWDNLGANLRDNLRDNLRANLRDNLWDNLGDMKMSYEYPETSWWEIYWVGFYEFILLELFPSKTAEFTSFLSYCEHVKEVNYIIPFKDIVFISENPVELNLNHRGQLHSFDRPAMLYKDGYALFYSNGIKMPKALIEIEADKITTEMITKETNADTRAQILLKAGNNRLVDLLKYEVTDKFEEYELISFDIGDGRFRPHLKMNCPSTNLLHILGAKPEIKTCAEALAFLFDQKEYKRPIKEDGIERGGSLEDFQDGQVIYRHGDVCFKKYSGPIDTISDLKTEGIIHAGNNNNHEYISGLFEIQEINGKKIVVVIEDSTIGHNEHGNQTHPPGTYEVSIAMEYSHHLEESFRVKD